MRACESCGKIKLLASNAQFCNVCKWTHGEVWELDVSKPEDKWKFELKVLKND